MLLERPKISPAALFTVALLGFPAVALSADAQAASKPPVRVSAASSQVSAGVVVLKVHNRSGRTVRGRVAARAGRTAAGSAGYKAKGRRTARVRLTLSAAARRKLAADRRLRLTLTATVRGRGRVTSAITVTGKGTSTAPQGRAPGKGGGKGSAPAQGQPGQGPSPAPESPNWVARTSSSGAYDDFAFTLSAGQITVTQRPLAYLQCSENGGSYRSYGSWEVFLPTGPWTLGAQSQEMTQTTSLVNGLAGSSGHSVRYQLRSTRSGGAISGQLTMSAAWSNYDYSTNRIVFVNCSGTRSFDAVQR